MCRKILIVDNDSKNIRLLRDVLTHNGYSVIEAGNGSEGISKAKEDKPELILLDMSMPVMGGLEAARIIKQDPDLKNIPIIALTSRAMPEEIEKIRKAGCDDCMTKPFDIKELLRRIESLFEVITE